MKEIDHLTVRRLRDTLSDIVIWFEDLLKLLDHQIASNIELADVQGYWRMKVDEKIKEAKEWLSWYDEHYGRPS